MTRFNWFENASFGNRQAAKPGETAPTLKQINQFSKDLWKQGRRNAREDTDSLKLEAALALDLIAETALSVRALKELGRGEEIYREGGRYWIVVPGSETPLELSSRLSRRFHHYIKETGGFKADGKRSLFSDSDGNRVSFRLISRELNTSLVERFGEDFKFRDFIAEAAQGSYQPQNPGTPADQPGSESDPAQPGSESDPVKPARQSSGLQSLSNSTSNILPRTIAGLTWIQDAALIGSEEYILWPGVGRAKITVKDQPGVVTDVAVAVSLSSTQSSTNQEALYLTLISPAGVRVPIAGSTLEPSFQAYGGTYEPGSVLRSPVGGTRSYLISETRQSKDNFELDSTIEAFLNGDNSQASLSTLSTLTGTNGNGEWQLEVTNSQAHSIQLNGWQLFLKTAEKSAETNASGKYSFSDLSASSASGPITPWITAPSDRAILSPAGGLNAKTELAHKAADISFGLSSEGAGSSSSGSEESAWSRFDLSQLIDQTSLHPQTTLNQAVTALTADAARAKYGVDGSGLRVGIISTSYNRLNGEKYDISKGLLDQATTILHEGLMPKHGKDEGRAMAQLVHSIAPGAELYFSAFSNIDLEGVLPNLIAAQQKEDKADLNALMKTTVNNIYDIQKQFADRILELAKEKDCKIIVDDMGIIEPWFQDGIVSQAIQEAQEKYGVTYFVAASNSSNKSYFQKFNPVTSSDLTATELKSLPETLQNELLKGNELHRFQGTNGNALMQTVSHNGGTDLQIQWNESWGGNTKKLKVILFNAQGEFIRDGLTDPEGKLPLALLPTFDNNGQPQDEFIIAIVHEGAEDSTRPDLFKWYIDEGSQDVAVDDKSNIGFGSSTNLGHTNPPVGTSVAAVDYWSTPAYQADQTYLSDFSSWGVTPIFFDSDGNRLAEPEYRTQPFLSAPQFGDTSFFDGQVGPNTGDVEINYLKNFAGTSAAAPNAAAVAALMLQLNPDLTPVQIFEALKATATPVTAVGSETTDGFNNASGYGLINAMAALDHIAQFSLSGTVYEDSNGDGQQNAGEAGLEGIQVFLDSNGNGRFDANSNWQSFTATASGGDSVSEVTPPTLVKDTLTGLLIDSRYDNVIHGTDKLNSNTPFSESSLLISSITSSSDYDVITEGGKDITLNGDLLLQFEGSSSKTAGSYSILRANSISGSFDNILVEGLDSNLYFGIGIEGGDNIQITVSETSFVGSTKVGSLY